MGLHEKSKVQGLRVQRLGFGIKGFRCIDKEFSFDPAARQEVQGSKLIRIQGYLAYKKQRPPGTLQWDYA